MAANLRFGLEIEFHGIKFTFRRRADGASWARPAPGVSKETTMIALNTVLQPLDPGAGFLNGPAIMWESNWGFRAVCDAFAEDNFTVAGVNHQCVSTILELATSASPVMDYSYWVTSRKCSQKFAETINDFSPQNLAQLPPGTLPAPGAAVQHFVDTAHNNRTWIPIQVFLDRYNAKLQTLSLGVGANGLPPGMALVINRFKLAKSQELVDFENGNYPGFIGGQWDAFVSSKPQDEHWCDVQVNYQIGLRALYNNLDDWVNAWSSQWISFFTANRMVVDPNVDDTRAVANEEPYRIQFYAAMWRRAKQLVEANFLNIPVAHWNALGMGNSLVKALITYVLVCSSVTNPLGAGGLTTSKNRYPQLCKTSPQSIKEKIDAIPVNGTAAIWNALTQPATAYLAKGQSDSLRININLVNAGCLDPAAGPVIGGVPPAYANVVPDILGLPNPPFQQTWQASFTNHGPANALAAGNKFGFTTAAPFLCPWAHEVNSSYEATVFNVNDIKVLFESRYSRCMINLGFNPYVRGFVFNRSYRRLVKMLAGVGQDNEPALVDLLALHFPDNGLLRQNFEGGHH